MNLLAFDTCLDKMYVVLSRDTEVLSSQVVETNETKYHSAYLISTVAKMLNENNLKPKDLDAIAINIGPGSFTGIRACTTVARVMAQQLNIKAIGVSSLEILSKLAPPDKEPLVAMDARKEMAYVWNNGIKGAVLLSDVKEMIASDDYFVITDDKLLPILGGISYQANDYKLGEILSEIAIEKLKNESGDWQKLLPLYIQPPPVFGK